MWHRQERGARPLGLRSVHSGSAIRRRLQGRQRRRRPPTRPACRSPTSSTRWRVLGPHALYHLLGIDPDTIVMTPANRPVKLIAEDAPLIKGGDCVGCIAVGPPDSHCLIFGAISAVAFYFDCIPGCSCPHPRREEHDHSIAVRILRYRGPNGGRYPKLARRVEAVALAAHELGIAIQRSHQAAGRRKAGRDGDCSCLLPAPSAPASF